MYVNSDTNGRGFLGIEGSHTLEHFVNGVARDVNDPETNLTVWKRAQLYLIAHPGEGERQEARNRSDLRIDALGSGSDYAPFLDFAGIASINLGFYGESEAEFTTLSTTISTGTRILPTPILCMARPGANRRYSLMRMADAELLPFDFHNFATLSTPMLAN